MTGSNKTLRQAQLWAQTQLSQSDSPRLDAEILLSLVLQKPRSYLMTWPEKELTTGQQKQLEALVQRRAAGEPIAHITGQQEFWSLNFSVTTDTLIPRPETELLVETALEKIPSDAAWQVADLGTGSGAIALAIAHERPHCKIFACDQSRNALQVAEQNARQLGIGNVQFFHGSWLEPFADNQFNLIASNPPYVANDDPYLEQNVLRFEPRSALTSGADGLADIRHIASEAKLHLKANGWLLLEHGWQQAAAAREIFEENSYINIESRQDLSGHQRITLGRAQ